MPGRDPAPPERETASAPLLPLLVITGLASLGTGVFWHGVPFIARSVHGFEAGRALLLLTVMGAVYAAGAFFAHAVTERVSASPRTLLIGSILAQAAACLPTLLVDAEWTLWLGGIVVSIASSLTWPIVEAYLGAGRRGRSLRGAIRGFNLIWMPAVALPMFVLGPHMDTWGARSIGVLGVTSLAAAVVCLAIPRVLPRSSAETSERSSSEVPPIPASYPSLLIAARALLPITYLLMAAMSPLLPYKFASLDIPVERSTPTTAIWMGARITVLFVLASIPGWHGRWWPMWASFVTAIGGFAMVMLAPSLAVMVIGFALFGLGAGAAYDASLYYGLAVGRSGVDSGGAHEALIGLGYGVGPAIALIGLVAADWTGTTPFIGTLVLLALTASGAAVPAVRAWSQRPRA